LHGLTDHAGLFTLQEQVQNDPRPDIDILFIGDSMLRFGVDAGLVEQEMSQALGRPARVLMFGFQHRGEEVYYLALRDLLAHHKRPKLLVLNLPRAPFHVDRPHPSDWELVSPGESPAFYEGLAWRYRFRLYAEQVLGFPRVILALLHDRHAALRPDDHGSALREDGFEGAPFVRYTPPVPQFAARQMIYSAETKDRWSYEGGSLFPYAENFDRKLVALAAEHHIPLVALSVPLQSRAEHRQIMELTNWSTYFGVPIRMVGVPPAELFAGLSADEIKKLYWNDHFNANGSRYFTKAIMPALLQLYRDVTATPERP
jgi:hypothetical protein